jgi:hypothetical protein
MENYEALLQELSVRKLQRFFPGIKPKPYGGSTTLTILVGHNLTFDEIKLQSLSWWIDNDFGFFEKSLQLLDGHFVHTAAWTK